MLFISRIPLYLMIFFVFACAPTIEEQALTSEQKPLIIKESSKVNIEKSWQQVTVKYLNFEGGFHGLVSKNGEKMLPMNLPVKYKVDGTILRVEGHFIKDMATTQQWGKPFKVTNIELIKMGKGDTSTH